MKALVPLGLALLGVVACADILGFEDGNLALPSAGGSGGASTSSNSGGALPGGSEPMGGAGFGGTTAGGAGGCTANLSSDPHNCGACGHDCLGGGCSNGKCQPFDLVTGQPDVRSVYVTAVGLYFALTQSIWRSDLNGGSAVELVNTLGVANNIRGIAVSTERIFWSEWDKNRIRSAALDGSDVKEEWPLQTGPWDIDVNATHVYWANENDGRIARGPVGGGPVEQWFVDTAMGSRGLALLSTRVYWTVEAVQYAELGAPTPQELIANQGGARGMTADSTMVCWAIPAGSVMCASHDGSGLMAIAANESGPIDVAIDAARIYWANNTTGVVRAVAR